MNKIAKGKKMFGTERLGLLFLAIVITIISILAMARTCHRHPISEMKPNAVLIDSIRAIKLVSDTTTKIKAKAKKKYKKTKTIKPQESFQRDHLSETVE